MRGDPVLPRTIRLRYFLRVPDFDSPWKEAIPRFFRPLMELCFPAIAAAIDWECGFEFLDTELHELLRGGNPGRQHVDKLVRVQLRTGDEQLILIHLEVQHWPEGGFPARLYSYHTRLGEKGLPVVTVRGLAVPVRTQPKPRVVLKPWPKSTVYPGGIGAVSG